MNIFKRTVVIIITVSIIIFAFFLSCTSPGGGTDSSTTTSTVPNNAPTITSFVAVPPTFAGLDVTMDLTVEATDDDSDPLNYAYQVIAGSGILAGTGNTVKFQALNTSSQTIMVTVTDGKGGEATDDVTVTYACFVAGTLVSTPSGLKAIETLKTGESVYAYDLAAGDTVTSSINKTFVHVKTGIYTITVGNDVIKTTEEHPFYVVNKGWINVAVLATGDVLQKKDGSTAAINTITRSNKTETVYNIRVDQYNNYFVSSNAYLVHNK